jgi:hypothetical protein
MSKSVTRVNGGRWVKGQSGNPDGRPRQDAHIRELARAHSADSIATLDQLRRKSKNDMVRFHAAVALLDRGYGKPTNYIEAGSSIADEIDKIKRRGAAWVEASQTVAIGTRMLETEEE